MPRFLLGLVLVLSLGCSESEDAFLKTPDGCRSGVILLGGTEAVGIEIVEGAAVEWALKQDAVAVFYADPLADLMIPVGIFRLPIAGRPLVPFVRAVAIDLDGSWRPIDALPPNLEHLRLPAFDTVACIDSGRCYQNRDGAPRCTDCTLSAIAPPVPPERPLVLRTACPEGWSPVVLTTGAPEVCRPPLRVPSCGPDEVQWLASTACERVGPACPSGRWAPELVGIFGVLFVDASASPGGDGRMSAPYQTIAEAIAAATEGSTIAVGKGHYVEDLWLDDDVHLVGACVAETRIESSRSLDVLRQVTMRNLAMVGSTPVFVSVHEGSTLRLQDVVVEGSGAQTKAISVSPGGRATLHRASVHGGGVSIRGEADADMLVVEAGEALVRGGALRGRRIVIPAGIEANNARLELEEALLTDFHLDKATSATATDIWIEGAEVGVTVTGTSTLHLERAVLHDNAERDLRVLGAFAELVDIVAIGASDAPRIDVVASASVSITRGWIDAQRIGVFASVSYLSIEDLTCRIHGQIPTELHTCLWISGDLVGKRIEVLAENARAILAEDCDAELEDLILRGTRSECVEDCALWESHRGSVAVHRVSVTSENIAAIDWDDSRIEAFDVSVTTPGCFDAIRARGSSEKGRLERVAVTTPVKGISIEDSISMDLRDLTIAGASTGVRVTNHSLVDLLRFEIRASRNSGVELVDRSGTGTVPEVFLSDGRIEDCATGLRVSRREGLELSQFVENVSFANNAENVLLVQPD